MISALFETDRFRVHITGKAAWVETKEGPNWVFCNWHALPVADACNDSDALKAAVEHYEAERCDNGLRSALTGNRQEPAKPVIKPTVESALKHPAKAALALKSPRRFSSPLVRAASSARAKKSSGYHGFRAPLRPPLLTPAVAALGPNASGD